MTSQDDLISDISDKALHELGNDLENVPNVFVEIKNAVAIAAQSLSPAWIPMIIVIFAVGAVYGLARMATSGWRYNAIHKQAHFVGLVKLIGLDLLCVAMAALAGRILLVRWLHITPLEPTFQTEFIRSLLRWMFGVTLAQIVFRTHLPKMRLASLDDAGARRAFVWVSVVLAVGHLHSALLMYAQSVGMSSESAKLISLSVALMMSLATLSLALSLKAHGLKPSVQIAAIGLILLTLLLWAVGWITLNFNLYYGIISTISVMTFALVLDWALALGIRSSRHIRTQHRLFTTRLVLDTLALAVVARIFVQFWLTNIFGWISQEHFSAIAGRLTLASLIIIAAVWLSCLIYVWTEAKLAPHQDMSGSAMTGAHDARLATILPVMRLGAIVLVLGLFILIAMSILGIDITPLMAGAGIIGLAISLGSQSLVNDVVTGILHMIDDDFRIGENITVGGRSGTLELISPRSIRLREEDGRLHTIPFSQLGLVTNHSRKLVSVSIRYIPTVLPQQGQLISLRRALMTSLQSEPALRTKMVGGMSFSASDQTEAVMDGMEITFRMNEGAARLNQALIHELSVEALQNTGAQEGAAQQLTVTIKVLNANAAGG